MEIRFDKDNKIIVPDVIKDIALGICNNQTLTNNKRLEESGKNNKLFLKTNIIKDVTNHTLSAIDQIKDERKYKGDKEFILKDNTKVIVIDYPPFTDWVLIQYNNNKPIKVNKKYFNSLVKTKKL